MITKALPWFTYVQSISFCLVHTRCKNCLYFDNDYCSLYDGLFDHLPDPAIRLSSLVYAENQHFSNYSFTGTCTKCLFSGSYECDGDCSYSNFMKNVGEHYENRT